MKRLFLLLLVAAVAVSGCNMTTTTVKKRTKIVRIQKVFSNIPLYPNLSYDASKSFVYESGNIKAAVIALSGSANFKDVVDFYKTKMVESGWELVSLFIYQDKANLFFDSVDSTCNVEVKKTGASSVDVMIRVGSKAVINVK